MLSSMLQHVLVQSSCASNETTISPLILELPVRTASAWLTELTSYGQLQLAAVNGYGMNLTPG